MYDYDHQIYILGPVAAGCCILESPRCPSPPPHLLPHPLPSSRGDQGNLSMSVHHLGSTQNCLEWARHYGGLLRHSQCTVEPPNKGHIGDNINSTVLSFVERLSSLRGSKCIRAIGSTIFGTSTRVLCREVFYTVPLHRRVH